MATKTKKPLTSKQRTNRVIITAIIVTVALLIGSIGGAIAYSNYINSGGASRRLISLKSDHYKVNNCMLTYYYFTDVFNFYQSYGAYISYIAPSQQAPDLTTSLSTQYYDYGTETGTQQTWHEYLMNMTLSNVHGYLYYAEEALANNFECDVDSLINDYFDTLKTDAASVGITIDEYITKFFGNTVKEKDIRAALELQYYASEYLSFLEGNMKKAVTEDDLTKFAEENKDSLNFVDYYSYVFAAEVPEGATDEDKVAFDEANKAAATALEEVLAQTEDKPAAFTEWVTAYIKEMNAVEAEPLSEEDLATEIETATTESTDKTTDNGDFGAWAFAEERVAGDVTVIKGEDGAYTLYLLTNPSHKNEEPTKNVHHILITADKYGSDEKAKAKAEEVLDEFLKGGKLTGEAFDTFAEKYNEDSSSYYENVKTGQMVEAFENWTFDEARQVGDTGVVKTEYGYHVMFFDGEGLPTWKVTAIESIVKAETEQLGTELQAKYEDTIEVNTTNLLKVPDALPASAFVENTDTTASTTTTTDTSATTDTEAETSDDTTEVTGDETSEETSEETAA